MHRLTDRIERTMTFVMPVVEHWLDQEITQWDPSDHERMPYDRATTS